MLTEESTLHLQLVVFAYVEGGKRLRPSARPKLRLSTSQFETYCDYACMVATALADGRQLASWTPEKEAMVKKAFFQKFLTLLFVFFLCSFVSDVFYYVFCCFSLGI